MKASRSSKAKPAAAVKAPPARRHPGRVAFARLPDQLVIFLDVLGFSKVVGDADAPAALHRAYRTLLDVQSRVDLPSAGENELELAAQNRDYGKQVLALSDSIVIAVDPASYAANARNPFDILCLELIWVLHAQMQLVAKGIFLRGGISHGKFFSQDNLLISPALVRAHELESKIAKHPRILIGQSTLDWLRGLRGHGYHAADPTVNYLRPVLDLPAGAEPAYMLDYLPEHAREFGQTRWVDPKDHRRFVAAPDGWARQAILEEKWRKGRQLVIRVHRQKVERAFRRADDKVRPKYAWLLNYHNTVAREFGDEMDGLHSTLVPPPGA